MRGKSKAGSTSSYSSSVDEATYLSSRQIWKTLIHLMWLTLRPLANQTEITLDLLMVIIASTADHRRKLTVLESADCLDYSYRLLFHSPDVVLRATLNVLGTERTVLQWFVHNYLEDNYIPKSWGAMDQSQPSFQDAQLREYTQEFYDLYCDFRKKVANRYIKLAFSQAAKNQWARSQFGLISDLKDNEQNYFLAALRGVDKFYPGNGTLAGYIMPWLKNAAGSQYTMYVGEAFNLSRPVRKAVHDGTISVNNKSVGIEAAEYVPIEDTLYDETAEKPIVTRLSLVQQTSYMSLVFALNQFPVFFTDDMLRKALTQADNLPSNWTPPKVELDDIPVVKPLSRSSRKDSVNQQRRKQELSNRKRSRD